MVKTVLEHKDIFNDIQSLLNQKAELPQINKKLWDNYGTKSSMLILDSVGFTRITQSHSVAYYLTLLVKIRNIVYEVFSVHNCTFFYTVSDNIYAEFQTPTLAYEAAYQANKAIAKAKLMLTESEPFRICIGIGYGEVLRSGSEGLFGDEMNLASKLGEDIADPNEILLTKTAYDNLDGKYKNRFEKKEIAVSGVRIEYYFSKCD